MKYNIYQKLHNSNGHTFSFIPHVCYFSYQHSIAASEARSLTTPLSTKMRGLGWGGGRASHKNINIHVSFYQNSVTPPLPFAKSIKNLSLSMQDTYIDRGLCSFLMQILKTVSRLLNVNWLEHFIRWGCFQVCSGNNNTSLFSMLVKLSFDKQEQGVQK